MNNRGYAILIIIVLIIVIGIAAASSGTRSPGSSTPTRPDPKYKATITADTVGLDYIIVTNENIPAEKILLPTVLPYTMNFAKDDILTFTVQTKDGYIFNTWDIGDGTFRSNNPMAIKPNNNFVIHASVIPDTVIPWDLTQ